MVPSQTKVFTFWILFLLSQVSESKERCRQEQENANKARKQLSDAQQRLTLTEQNLHDLNAKNSELQTSKSLVEKELRDLRLQLENETLNRNQDSEQKAELHGELVLMFVQRTLFQNSSHLIPDMLN